MTQEERWNIRYNEVKSFVEKSVEIYNGKDY
jgi:hypothetical protein